MAVSDSKRRPTAESGDAASSDSPGGRKTAEKARLADALRANLGRRKAQQRERGNPPKSPEATGAVRNETAQKGAGSTGARPRKV